jgi:hypothetical protein
MLQDYGQRLGLDANVLLLLSSCTMEYEDITNELAIDELLQLSNSLCVQSAGCKTQDAFFSDFMNDRLLGIP